MFAFNMLAYVHALTHTQTHTHSKNPFSLFLVERGLRVDEVCVCVWGGDMTEFWKGFWGKGLMQVAKYLTASRRSPFSRGIKLFLGGEGVID